MVATGMNVFAACAAPYRKPLSRASRQPCRCISGFWSSRSFYPVNTRSTGWKRNWLNARNFKLFYSKGGWRAFAHADFDDLAAFFILDQVNAIVRYGMTAKDGIIFFGGKAVTGGKFRAE